MMRIVFCGNIDLQVIAEQLDNIMPGNDIITGLPEKFEDELRTLPGTLPIIDLCILALDWKKILPEAYEWGYGDDTGKVNHFIATKIDSIKSTIFQFRATNKAPILIFSPVTDNLSSFGFIDRIIPSSRFEFFSDFQKKFNQMCASITGVYPIDLEMLSSQTGKENAFNRETEYTTDLPYSAGFTSIICKHIGSICSQLFRSPLKCIVLDLDNTLWGGTAGEDGVKGVVLGNTREGKAYRDFQMEIVKLYKQGILIALCSKNNTCDALEIMELNQNMLLRPDMVACFRINWDDKPKNIQEISAELNIGLNSIMFIDDNPAERELVRISLPEVEILELPCKPSGYADSLRKCTRFWPVELTAEDAGKTASYHRERLRKNAAELMKNKEDFLIKSQIKAKIETANTESLPRIAQLFQKTNQFNLTTRRYNLSELESFQKAPQSTLFYMELSDNFGPYGIIAAALLMNDTIDSFILSCRVFGKKAETFFLSHILDFMHKKGISVVKGIYIPSQKNSLVKDFYLSHGFDHLLQDAEKSIWKIDLNEKSVTSPHWITVEQ